MAIQTEELILDNATLAGGAEIASAGGGLPRRITEQRVRAVGQLGSPSITANGTQSQQFADIHAYIDNDGLHAWYVGTSTYITKWDMVAGTFTQGTFAANSRFGSCYDEANSQVVVSCRDSNATDHSIRAVDLNTTLQASLTPKWSYVMGSDVGDPALITDLATDIQIDEATNELWALFPATQSFGEERILVYDITASGLTYNRSIDLTTVLGNATAGGSVTHFRVHNGVMWCYDSQAEVLSGSNNKFRIAKITESPLGAEHFTIADKSMNGSGDEEYGQLDISGPASTDMRNMLNTLELSSTGRLFVMMTFGGDIYEMDPADFTTIGLVVRGGPRDTYDVLVGNSAHTGAPVMLHYNETAGIMLFPIDPEASTRFGVFNPTTQSATWSRTFDSGSFPSGVTLNYITVPGRADTRKLSVYYAINAGSRVAVVPGEPLSVALSPDDVLDVIVEWVPLDSPERLESYVAGSAGQGISLIYDDPAATVYVDQIIGEGLEGSLEINQDLTEGSFIETELL